ncbi:unnamed protein product, partial [Callosobruchus maculatus]
LETIIEVNERGGGIKADKYLLQLIYPSHSELDCEATLYDILPRKPFRSVSTMYTNPFSRTHSSVRQVIDRFLNVDRKKKDSFALKRNTSDCSVCSESSSWSSSSKNSAKKLVKFVK